MSELWKELHTRALKFKGVNDTIFLLNFARRIPRYTKGCKCKEFWSKWIKDNPPDYKNYFDWTVKAHNAVNKKLGKTVYSVEEARKLYELGK